VLAVFLFETFSKEPLPILSSCKKIFSNWVNIFNRILKQTDKIL